MESGEGEGGGRWGVYLGEEGSVVGREVGVG